MAAAKATVKIIESAKARWCASRREGVANSCQDVSALTDQEQIGVQKQISNYTIKCAYSIQLRLSLGDTIFIISSQRQEKGTK